MPASWPGRLVLDRSFVSELVHGPLSHGRSRLTFDQVAALAVRVAARDGIAPLLDHLAALIAGYEAVFADLAHLGPVLTVDTARAA